MFEFTSRALKKQKPGPTRGK